MKKFLAKISVLAVIAMMSLLCACTPLGPDPDICEHRGGTATCTEAAVCERCGHAYGEALSHDYEGVVTAPTCLTGGFTTYTCHCGDTYVGDEVEATGHDYEAVVTEPTCREAGFTTYTCHCGDSYVGDETPTIPHVDTNLDITCDYPGCTKRILPAGDSKISLFTANAMIIVSLNSNYYVEGTVTEVTNATSGIFVITDEVGDTLLVRLPKKADGLAYASWNDYKICLGDVIQVYGKPSKNTGTPTNVKAKIEGGQVTVLKHTHTFSEPTCTEQSTCPCLAVGTPALGHEDLNLDNICDRCNWNLNLKISNIVVKTNPAAGGILTDDKTSWTWANDDFAVVIAKAKSTFTLYTTSKDYMQLKKQNTLTVQNKKGAMIKTVAISAYNATQLNNLEKALANNGLTFTKNAEDLTITIEWNSTNDLVITHNGTTTAYVTGVEVVYETV